MKDGSLSGQLTATNAVANSAQDSGPFFIVGAGRSGSTLLRMMLISHSRICIPPETWYLMPLLERFTVDTPMGPTEIESAINIMTSHYRWPDMNISIDLLRNLISKIDKPRLRDIVEVVYLWHMSRDRKFRWGDKSPPYVSVVPALARLFPDAKFIHLLRDGHDVTASFLRQGWNGTQLYASAREWIAAVNFDRSWRGSSIEERLLRVRYEDLVLDTEATLRRICQFIGEEFEKKMLLWQEHVDSSVPARERAIHKKLKIQPSSRDVFRWRRELSSQQIWVIESLMSTQLKEMGYERKFHSRLSVPLMAGTRAIYRSTLPVVDLHKRAFGFFRRRLQTS